MAAQLGLRCIIADTFKTLWWVPETMSPETVRAYLKALDRAEKAFVADPQKYLPLWKREPEDLGLRLELQLASWLAYFGPANTPMGLSHELGRRIGASYGVPHGITSCIILAPSLEVVEKRIRDGRWRMLAQALGGTWRGEADLLGQLFQGDPRIAGQRFQNGLPRLAHDDRQRRQHQNEQR